MLQTFRDLTVWQKSMDLAVELYVSTENFPRSEVYGLTAQMRKAAVSIPSNIAEGKALSGQNYPRHLRIALGSEAEMQTQIELANRLKMLADHEAGVLLQHTAEVGRMLTGLLNALPRD
jgi:four helix bundle protein